MPNRVIIGKGADGSTSGLFVSRFGENVLDPVHAVTGNLMFDSSDYTLGTLKVLQTGTFQIQCKKTYFGKKGGLELSSDEAARANAEYTHRYPFELDTVDDAEGVYAGKGMNSQYVSNVYCDYGSQTIEFNPPLPGNIKTPQISVSFALANSTGHFHPWYANVTCDNSDYNWQYANSQHCVHMDSAWFRGKWSHRERSIMPFGMANSVHQRGSATIGDISSTPFQFNDPGGLHDTGMNAPSQSWGGIFKSFAGLQGLVYNANNTHLKIEGYLTPTHSPTPFETEIRKKRIVNPSAGERKWLKDHVIDNTPTENRVPWQNVDYNDSPNSGVEEVPEFDPSGNIRKNVGVGLNDPTSPRGWVPRHAGSHGDHPGTATHVDNYFWGFTEVPTASLGTGDMAGKGFTSGIIGAAWANNYGDDYKEELPRYFRTNYWDGSSTEYEWWPSGHANGGFIHSTNGVFTVVNINPPGYNFDSNQEAQTAILNKEIENRYPEHVGTLREFGNSATYGDWRNITPEGYPFNILNQGTRFPNQLPATAAKGYPPNSQYEPGDAFLKTRTFQGQPTSLDSFWNSFSNNMSQWVSANTPYGEFYYADGGYAMNFHNGLDYMMGGQVLTGYRHTPSGEEDHYYARSVPSDFNPSAQQSFAKHNWFGGNPKAGVGTEGRKFGFGGAGSADALGGEGPGVFDTYYGTYIVYDLSGGDSDE